MAKSKSNIAKQINNKATFQELFDRINCDTGLIFIDTPEETRIIREIYKEYTNESVQFWSIRFGLHAVSSIITEDPGEFYPHDYNPGDARVSKINNRVDSRNGLSDCLSIIEEDCREKLTPPIKNIKKSIYVLRDADKYFQNPAILRQVRDTIYMASCASSVIIMTGFGITVPSDLTKDAVFLKISYPTKEEILHNIVPLVENEIKQHNIENKSVELMIDPNFDKEEVTRACAGLTEDQIFNVLQYTTTVDGKISIDRVLEEKKAIINKSDILEYWICDTSLNDVGGFKELKDWFNVRKVVMESPHAEEFGAKYPKGIMLLGAQGSGKTYIAKSVAATLKMGAIKLEMGKVFAGLVGESEKRMRQALAQIEAAGGVVIIDEIDKGLSGAGSSNKSDGGTTSRVIGTLLTWLQEEHPGVFLIATANDISALLDNHPELLRKGRFDEIWFSDLPSEEERKEIFKIHLEKTKRDVSKFDIDALAKIRFNDAATGKTFDYTGAEIQYAIGDAIQDSFSKGKGKQLKIGSKDDITTEIIIEKLNIIKPISKIAHEPINKMRRWAKENARNVSSVNVIVEKEEKTSIKSNSVNLRNRTKIKNKINPIDFNNCDL